MPQARKLIEETEGRPGLTVEVTGWVTIHRDGVAIDMHPEDFAGMARAYQRLTLSVQRGIAA